MTSSLPLRPALYQETVPGGGHTSFVLKRGQLLRITDLEGGANVSLMLLNATEKSERLNLPDSAMLIRPMKVKDHLLRRWLLRMPPVRGAIVTFRLLL